MSGTFPTTPEPISVTVSSVAPSMVSTSHALNRQARTRNAQRWGFSLTYPKGLPRDDIRALWAFLIAQKGRSETFTFYLPTMYNRGAGGGPGAVVGAGQTGPTVATDGWVPGAGIMAGDFVRLGNHNKVYMITADSAADSGGLMTLPIVPPLVQSPSDNYHVYLHAKDDPIRWTCALTSDAVQIDIDHCEQFGLQLELEEVV
jgi:hypothetical protein